MTMSGSFVRFVVTSATGGGGAHLAGLQERCRRHQDRYVLHAVFAVISMAKGSMAKGPVLRKQMQWTHEFRRGTLAPEA